MVTARRSITVPKDRVPYEDHATIDLRNINVENDNDIAKDNGDPNPDVTVAVRIITSSARFRICRCLEDLGRSGLPVLPAFVR